MLYLSNGLLFFLTFFRDKEATKESPAQAPAKKAGAKELPNTGTKQSNASLGLALLAAVTGGLLISKKREEEE